MIDWLPIPSPEEELTKIIKEYDEGITYFELVHESLAESDMGIKDVTNNSNLWRYL